MRPLSSSALKLRELYIHGYWRPIITGTIGLYLVLVLWSSLQGAFEYFTTHEVSLKSFNIFMFFSLIRYGLFVGIPYTFLVYWRDRDTRHRLRSEDRATRKARDRIAIDYESVSSMTIFYPDAFEDELSVCAYTGATGATPKQRCSPCHLNAASIIAHPHIAYYKSVTESARSFVSPELHVVDGGRSASPLTRLAVWLDTKFDYIFKAQTRDNIGRRYEWNGAPCAFAQRADVVKAVDMTTNIMKTHNDKPIVLFGSGRGANIALEVYVRLSLRERRRVRGVVLEGLVTDRLTLLNLTRSYRAQHPDEPLHDPLGIIQNMPTSDATRFLLVVSQGDTVADTSSFFDAYSELDLRASNMCAHIRLDNATRGSYATHNSTDACAYEEAALAFYRLIDSDLSIEKDLD